MSKRNILYVIIALLLMIFPLILQSHMKKAPQIIALIFGALAVISLPTKKEFLILPLFYLVFALVIFLNCNQIVYTLVKALEIDMSAMTDCDGCSASYGGLILGNWIGAVLAPTTVYLYHRKIGATSPFRNYFLIIFLAAISITYVLFELLHVQRW